MLTRLKLRLGKEELVEANTEIGRVYSQSIMVEEAPLGSESQFIESFMTIRAIWWKRCIWSLRRVEVKALQQANQTKEQRNLF